MEAGNRRAAAASAALPDELVVEILARLPARSLCRFRCVSRAWRDLISDPSHRRRFAQPLSGLFFSRPHGSRRPPWGFVGWPVAPPPGVDTDLSFLPPATCGETELLDSCNGLVLLRCSGAPGTPSPPFYAVCNPATGEWVALPPPSRAPGEYAYFSEVGPVVDTGSAALGFDPSVSQHFHVFQLVQMLDGCGALVVRAMEIYSSETGRWVYRRSRCSESDDIFFTGPMTYFNGFLHFCIISNAVVSVDTDGQEWRVSRVRQDKAHGHSTSIGHSQGCLLYLYDNDLRDDSMSVFVREDQNSDEWTFKHSIYKPDLFGPRNPRWSWTWDYCVAAFHPNSDLIFFYDWPQKRLVSYDMKHRNVHVICNLEEVRSPLFVELLDVHRPFLPYIPLYSGALASPSAS